METKDKVCQDCEGTNIFLGKRPCSSCNGSLLADPPDSPETGGEQEYRIRLMRGDDLDRDPAPAADQLLSDEEINVATTGAPAPKVGRRWNAGAQPPTAESYQGM